MIQLLIVQSTGTLVSKADIMKAGVFLLQITGLAGNVVPTNVMHVDTPE